MLNSIEWLVVGLLGLIVLIWGPAKLSDIAKAIKNARDQVDKISKGIIETAPKNNTASPLKDKDQALIETARGLGVDTAGKTREELSQAINLNLKNLQEKNKE